MLAALTEKIETLEHREAAGVKESIKETVDKKSREKGKPVTNAENTGQKPMPGVPEKVLDFLQAID